MSKQGLEIVASTIRKFNGRDVLQITGSKWYINDNFFEKDDTQAALVHCCLEALSERLTQSPSPCQHRDVEVVLDALASLCDPESIACF